MKKLLWFLFLVLVIYIGYQEFGVRRSTANHYELIQIEFADSTLAKTIFCEWRQIKYGSGTILDIARNNTQLDFLFIFDYTLLIIACSYAQMQNEENIGLNTLLRFNFVLASLLAILDVIENLKILYNIRHIDDAGLYSKSFLISTFKWILFAWIILIWVASLFKSVVQSRRVRRTELNETVSI